MSAPGVNQAVNAGMAVFEDAMAFAEREGGSAQDKATLGEAEIEQYKMSLVARGMGGDIQAAAVAFLRKVASWESVGILDKNDAPNIRARLEGSARQAAGDSRFSPEDLKGDSAAAAAGRLAAALNSDAEAARALKYEG